MKWYVIIITQILSIIVKCQTYKLYEHINQRYLYLSKKTSYAYVSPLAPYPEPDCKVLTIWMLSRHGTRNPKRKVIQEFSTLTEYQNINPEKSNLHQDEINEIKSWKSVWNEEETGKLNSQGIHDMKSLGQRMRNMYPDLFNEEYNTKNFTVISSPQQRCIDSAGLFLDAAFGRDVKEKIISTMHINDNRFNIFLRARDNRDLKQSKEFLDGPQIIELIQNVSKAVGTDEPLPIKTVRLMYEVCREQKSYKINFNSPWCNVFTERDLKILEYYQDLKYYYEIGYGNPGYTDMSLEILVDMLVHLRDTVRGKSNAKGVFYFGHTSNLFSILMGMSYAKDTSDLTSTNFESMHDRKFRMSFLGPYAGNIRAVLYQCADENKITIFVNDVPMYIEQHDCTLCPWKSIWLMLDQLLRAILIAN